MKELTFDFKNYVLNFSPKESRKDKAILMLHGFPSESFNGTDQEKNKDLLKFLSLEIKCDSYLHHYRGLGKSRVGSFSFIDSIKDSIELAKILLKKHQELILIGHSWGGLVAVNCFHELSTNIKQMIMLSPLNTLPQADTLRSIFEIVQQDFPYIMENKKPADFIEEFKQINVLNHPRDLIRKTQYDSKVLILQANEDTEVPHETTTEFYELFNGKCVYEIINSDHSFTKNRDLMFSKCKHFINNDV